MQDLARYRAMESLCRQVAAFRPLESWRLLAEAEMWHHKALQEISLHQPEHADTPPRLADRLCLRRAAAAKQRRLGFV